MVCALPPSTFQPSEIPEELAGAVLSIDLSALASNWRSLKAKAGSPRCGAAVKGNGYGLGSAAVAQALAREGCQDFFVARPKEGEELRQLLPQASIYILDGLRDGCAEFYAKNRLIPALTSLVEARQWAEFARFAGVHLPCALHVDTGINRLGFSVEEFSALTAEAETFSALNISLVMSHLACADQPSHPLNAKQNSLFSALRQKLPDVAASLANSSGIYLGPEYVHDLPRPGIALYGGNPILPAPNPMQCVVKLEGSILQIRHLSKGGCVGYGASWQAERNCRIAILGAGYEDGVPRALSFSSAAFKQEATPPKVWLAGHFCKVVGRISMDVMAIDITDVPEAEAKRGTRVEIFGPHIALDQAASMASTISYELLTRLGNRCARLYVSKEL